MFICFYLLCFVISVLYIGYRGKTKTLKEGNIDYDDLDIEYPDEMDRGSHFLLCVSYFLISFSVIGLVLSSLGFTVSFVGAVVGGFIAGKILELLITKVLENQQKIN